MEEQKKKASPWVILELVTLLLSPEDFQHYCDTHPEEEAAVMELFCPKDNSEEKPPHR